MANEVFIAGHSLGAARAFLYAYSRLKRGLPVSGVYAFGCPNPGDGIIGQVLAAGVPLIRNVRNRRDLVTDVPVDIGFLGENYVQVAPFEECDAPAPLTDRWGPFRDHHIALYQQGVRKLRPSGVGVELAEACDLVAALYEFPTTRKWDWLHPIDGSFWGMAKLANGAKLLISRGTTTQIDWLDDFEAYQVVVQGARVSSGFWDGVGRIESQLDYALAYS